MRDVLQCVWMRTVGIVRGKNRLTWILTYILSVVTSCFGMVSHCFGMIATSCFGMIVTLSVGMILTPYFETNEILPVPERNVYPVDFCTVAIVSHRFWSP